MSVSRKILLGLGGAAIMAAGAAGTANAQVVAASTGSCDLYAREYATMHAPRFGFGGWNTAYRWAYNECIAGGPSFVSASPYPAPAYSGPFAGLGALVTAPVVAAANVAGAAVNAGASIAGAALAAPAAVAAGTASALAPPVATAPAVSATAEPVVTKNYRGEFEAEPAAAIEAEPAVAIEAPEATIATTAALSVPSDTVAPAQLTPEWHAYCAAKYVSYNPDTGMYMAYSGTLRMCS